MYIIYIYIYIYIYIIYNLYLQDGAAKLFKWFSENQTKGKTDMCHLLMSQDNYSEIHIGKFIIKNSGYEKLLRIKIDSKLHF